MVQQVPLDALQAERSERQRLQEEVRLMRDNMALMQAQQKFQQNQHAEPESKLSDDDVLTVGEAKKYLNTIDNNYRMGLQELKIAQKYPDYQTTVTKYLPEVLKQNPS